MISDIHANVEALEAVLRHLDAARVDRMICLGDIVGYHASPNECVRLVRASCTHAIAGNHDRATLGTIGLTELGFVARRAVIWTAAHLEPDCAEFLDGLDIGTALDGDTYLVHAGLHPEPNDRFHVTTPERIAANLAALARRGMRLGFFGHTHRAVVHSLDGSTSAPIVALAPNRRYLVNPGSVGQPRDRDPRAACAIYDVERQRVEFVRVAYDHAACHRRAAAAGLLAPPGLARRGFEVARSVWFDASERLTRRPRA